MSKKALLGSLLCLFCTVNVIAGNPVSVKLGETSVLKNPSKAYLKIDYSAAKVGEDTLDEYLKKRGDDFVRDWPQVDATTATMFKEQFNKKSKGMTLVTDSTDVSYKFVIHVNSLDMGNGASAFVPFGTPKAGGVIMSGTIDIIDMQTDEVACTLLVDNVKGLGAFSETSRLGLMYTELAKLLCKLK